MTDMYEVLGVDVVNCQDYCILRKQWDLPIPKTQVNEGLIEFSVKLLSQKSLSSLVYPVTPGIIVVESLEHDCS